MHYCTQCGKEIEEVKFCPVCGAPQTTEKSDSYYTPPQGEEKSENSPPGGHSEYTEAKPKKEVSKDIEDNKLICIFCYFGLLLLIPLLIKPTSDYVKFHANQGLVLILFDLALGAAAIIPVVGWVCAAVGGVFSVVCLILGIVNTMGGHAKPLPIIGKVEILK